jgi:hypothetical protein
MDLVKINEVISYVRTGFKGKRFTNNPSPFTPAPLSKEILNKIPDVSGKIAVFFTVEFAVELRVRGADDVTIITEQHCPETKIIADYLGYKYMLLQDVEGNDMKFDVVVGNPPYQGTAETHQKFFNMAVELTKDGGIVSFIQPATPYFNKKEKVGNHTTEMISNIKKYRCEVKIVSGSVFAAANINTALAITLLTKLPNTAGNLVKYESELGRQYQNISIDAINMLDMDPILYQSLVNKVFNVVNKNGSIQELITTDLCEKKLDMKQIRGNAGRQDFYTLISRDATNWKVDTKFEYGLSVSGIADVSFLTNYLTSYIARFCLSIYKFNANNHRGELRSVPQVPFNVDWDDKKLCTYFGITDIEYAEIIRCIPDYHGKNVS